MFGKKENEKLLGKKADERVDRIQTVLSSRLEKQSL